MDAPCRGSLCRVTAPQGNAAMAVAIGDGKINEMYRTQRWERPRKIRVYMSFFPDNLMQLLSTISKYLMLPQEDLTSQSLLLRSAACPWSQPMAQAACPQQDSGCHRIGLPSLDQQGQSSAAWKQKDEARGMYTREKRQTSACQDNSRLRLTENVIMTQAILPALVAGTSVWSRFFLSPKEGMDFCME